MKLPLGLPSVNAGVFVFNAIQKMVWGSDDWLRALDGKGIPTLQTPAPTLVCRGGDGSSPAVPKAVSSEDEPSPPLLQQDTGRLSRYGFDDSQLPIDFQWLRSPWPALAPAHFDFFEYRERSFLENPFLA